MWKLQRWRLKQQNPTVQTSIVWSSFMHVIACAHSPYPPTSFPGWERGCLSPPPRFWFLREVADVNRLRKCILCMAANLWQARPRRMTTITSLANLLKHSRGCGNKANRKNKQSLRYDERRFEMPDFRRNFAAVQNIPQNILTWSKLLVCFK